MLSKPEKENHSLAANLHVDTCNKTKQVNQ